MTNEIKNFYWNANAENCINILNYELQGDAIAENNSWHNDASPSAIVTKVGSSDELLCTIFFPSSYNPNDMESMYVLFDAEDNHLMTFSHIYDVITYFQGTLLI